MAIILRLYRNGDVGFIDWLDVIGFLTGFVPGGSLGDFGRSSHSRYCRVKHKDAPNTVPSDNRAVRSSSSLRGVELL